MTTTFEDHRILAAVAASHRYRCSIHGEFSLPASPGEPGRAIVMCGRLGCGRAAYLVAAAHPGGIMANVLISWIRDNATEEQRATVGCLLSQALGLLVACALALGFTTSCAPVAGEAESTASVLTISRPNPRVVTQQRAGAVAIASARLRAGAELLTGTDDGRTLITLLTACALRPDAAITVPTPDGDLEFLGEFGLAPGWERHALGARGQGMVSACVFAKLSGIDVAVAISLRGPGLHADSDERQAWPKEEGAFLGNLFAPIDQPLPWFACRGRDGGANAARVCAEEDPLHPGTTRCGLTFLGACSEICERRRGSYRRCRVAGDVVHEVITSYVEQ